MRNRIALFVILLACLLWSCGVQKKETAASYGPSATALKAMLDNDPALKALVEESIQKAKAINPDTLSNPSQSLERFYGFISKAEGAMPWDYAANAGNYSTFEHMFQSLASFYFVIDQPLETLEGKGLYHPSLQYYPPFASWLTDFNNSWRTYLDSPQSWGETSTHIVMDDPAFGLQNGWYESPTNWKTFNQFFARHLQSPSSRPIAAPDDNSVVASYADAVPQGTWAINDSSAIVEEGGVAVKTSQIKQISKLIGEGSAFRDAFAGGTFTHSFLNINDYHRYHFPLGGTVKEVRVIAGLNPTGGTITWGADDHKYHFSPSSVNWQMLETRGCVILDTERFGLVALMPIGMAAVGSVNFEQEVVVGQKVKKGDPLGYFLFGGSDFIMIFQRKVDFVLDVPLDPATQSYPHLLMGERLGHMTLWK